VNARTPPDRLAGEAPVTPAGPAMSPAFPGRRGDVATPDPSPPVGGSGPASAPVTETSTVTGAGQVAAGKNAAAVDGKVTLPRPAAGFHALAAAMSEDRGPDSLDAHVRRLMKDLGLWGFHPFDSRRSKEGWPDWTIIGNRIIYRELKTEKGKVTPAQQAVGDILTAAGGDWTVWHPSDLYSGRIARELVAISRLRRAA